MNNEIANRTQHCNQERLDGRLTRSRVSRANIVAAILALVGNGKVNPSAARVAERAEVELRSVFRHFDDMDALYREMGDVIEARVRPNIVQRVLRHEMAAVEAQLPTVVVRDTTASIALSAILSFQTWRLLRHDQQLPIDQAQAVIHRLLHGTLAELADSSPQS